MPLARQALHTSGEHVHVEVWPAVHDMHQIASRHYSFVARCFVPAAGLIMRVRDLPPELDTPAELAADLDGLPLHGGSAVIGPGGRGMAGPVFDEETILTAEIDFSELDREKSTARCGYKHRLLVARDLNGSGG